MDEMTSLKKIKSEGFLFYARVSSFFAVPWYWSGTRLQWRRLRGNICLVSRPKYLTSVIRFVTCSGAKSAVSSGIRHQNQLTAKAWEKAVQEVGKELTREIKLQWATKVVQTLLGNDAFRYLSICSILFASSVNSLIPPAPQFNVV